MGHWGPKPGSRPAGPCRPAQHPCAPVHACFSLGHYSIYFLSLPTLLATTKLGRVRFRPSFSRRGGALLVASFIRCIYMVDVILGMNWMTQHKIVLV
jgi:hypothetical protein